MREDENNYYIRCNCNRCNYGQKSCCIGIEFNMKKSAGLIIIHKNTILLCHPTNHKWYGTYSIPKGEIEFGERPIDAAIRETEEEVGLTVAESWIDTSPIVVDYKNKQGRVFKKVYCFVANLTDIVNVVKVVPSELLQLNEIDWAGFLTKEEADHRIFHRFKQFLELI